MTTVALQELAAQDEAQKLSFTVTRGKITKTNMWSESHVGGGGGTKNNQHSVHTKVKNRRELWLLTDKGKDAHFVTNADKVSVMEGQDVSVLCMNWGKKQHVLLVRNYSQDQTLQAIDPLEAAMISRPVAVWIGGILLFCLFCISPIIMGFGTLLDIALYICLGLLAVAAVIFKRAQFIKGRCAEYERAMIAAE